MCDCQDFMTTSEGLGTRKLILLLTLDHALIHRGRFLSSERPPKTHAHFYTLKTLYSELDGQEEVELVVLRPCIRSFLYALSQRFQLGLLLPNMKPSGRESVREVLNILDPQEQTFGGRLLWGRDDLHRQIPDRRIACILGDWQTAGDDWWCRRLLLSMRPFYFDFQSSESHREVDRPYLPKLRSCLEELHTRFFNAVSSNGHFTDIATVIVQTFPAKPQSSNKDFPKISSPNLYLSETSDYDRREEKQPLSLPNQLPSLLKRGSVDERSDLGRVSPISSISSSVSDVNMTNFQLDDIKAAEYASIIREQKLLRKEMGRTRGREDEVRLFVRWNYLIRRKDRLFNELFVKQMKTGRRLITEHNDEEDESEKTVDEDLKKPDSAGLDSENYQEEIVDVDLSKNFSILHVQDLDNFWCDQSVKLFRCFRKHHKKCTIL